MFGCIFGWWSVVYYLWVTVTLTLTLDLVYIISIESGAYLIYFWCNNFKFGVWMHFLTAGCHIPFLGHCDLDPDLVFSSPEPKAHRWAISIPVTPASVVRRPSSVRPQFQTSSPLKPLGQLNSNFIWRLLRMGERKFVQMVLVTWPRWPPCPYMVKTL